MKKINLTILVVILVLIMVAGCSGGGPETYTDPAEMINVKADEEFVIALESNPTTGFAWEAEYDSAMLTLVEQLYESDEHEEGMVGVGGTDYLRFKALAAGSTEIKLIYSQPWEEEEGENDEHLTFNVEIK
jgi:inhibitor of cysteine peptidase